jgi:hypothetical protein
LLTGAAIRRDELALYFLLRGATLLIRCGNKAPEDTWLHKALVATRWKHGDSAMMCAATWQILFSYLMMPTTLPKGYIKFLDRMAGFDSWLIPVARVRLTLLTRSCFRTCHALTTLLAERVCSAGMEQVLRPLC